MYFLNIILFILNVALISILFHYKMILYYFIEFQNVFFVSSVALITVALKMHELHMFV